MIALTNDKLTLLKKYQNFTIYRWGIIVLLASPIPVAMTKLNGFNLSEWQITLVMILGNLMWMTSEKVNELPIRLTYLMAAVLDFVFMVVLLVAYLNDVALSVILIVFPTLSGAVAVLVSTNNNKIENTLKDLYKEDFALDKYNARVTKYLSAAGLAGQLVVMGVYSTGVVIDPLEVVVLVEVGCSIFLVMAEVIKYRYLKELGVF